MNLQTNIPLQPVSNQIDHGSKLLLMGSCFVENIGDKLDYFKFQSVVNPFGIIFQPKAIEKLILKAINQEEFTDKDVFFLNDRWHCFDAHSHVSDALKEQLLWNLNNALQLTNRHITESTHIIITLGTAWVYRFIETGELVANCHKVPQKKFLKELLPVDEIAESLSAIVVLIKNVNPKASVLFTVSPVRHLKDGFVENQRSKSHLISSVHYIMENTAFLGGGRGEAYFPSYEIMMDELRDYRYYAEDMVHLSQIAINYIWEKFKQVWIATDAFKVMDEVGAIQKGLAHKPFNPNSEQHQAFLQKLKIRIAQLHKQYPEIQF